MVFRKLSPTELSSRGYSSKSERYLNTTTGETVSKRTYQKEQQIGQYQFGPKEKERQHFKLKEVREKVLEDGTKYTTYATSKNGFVNVEEILKVMPDNAQTIVVTIRYVMKNGADGYLSFSTDRSVIDAGIDEYYGLISELAADYQIDSFSVVSVGFYHA